MKTTIKLFLIVCLFSSMALADDGSMTTGGKTCGNSGSCGLAAGGDESGDGGTGKTEVTADDQTAPDSILTFIQEYLHSIFG